MQQEFREIGVAHLPGELLAEALDHRQHRPAIQRLADCLCRGGIKGALQHRYLAAATVDRLFKIDSTAVGVLPGRA